MNDKTFSFEELKTSISASIFGFKHHIKDKSEESLFFKHKDGFDLEIFSPSGNTIYYKLNQGENHSTFNGTIIEEELIDIHFRNITYDFFGKKINQLLLNVFNYENKDNSVILSLPPNALQSVEEYIYQYFQNLGTIYTDDSLVLKREKDTYVIQIKLEYDYKNRFYKSLGLTYYPRYNIAYLHRKDVYWSEIPLLKNPTRFTCDLKNFKKLANIFQKFFLEKI